MIWIGARPKSLYPCTNASDARRWLRLEKLEKNHHHHQQQNQQYSLCIFVDQMANTVSDPSSQRVFFLLSVSYVRVYVSVPISCLCVWLINVSFLLSQLSVDGACCMRILMLVHQIPTHTKKTTTHQKQRQWNQHLNSTAKNTRNKKNIQNFNSTKLCENKNTIHQFLSSIFNLVYVQFSGTTNKIYVETH